MLVLDLVSTFRNYRVLCGSLVFELKPEMNLEVGVHLLHFLVDLLEASFDVYHSGIRTPESFAPILACQHWFHLTRLLYRHLL